MSTHSPQSSHLFSLISTLNALKELNIDIKAAVAVIEKGEGKKLVEKETGIPIFSVVKLDVIDGKVVIEERKSVV